jgi:hypothetical protein
MTINALEIAIEQALKTEGSEQTANKAYLEFIKANFIIPIEKSSDKEEPQVLFLQENNQAFLPVFSQMAYFDAWAEDIKEKVDVLKLSGVDLLLGSGDDVSVCLNIGSAIYKEFNPSELARMRSMVSKLFK